MDSLSNTFLFGILIALVFVSALFSSSETAIMVINRNRLKVLAKEGNKNAQLVIKLLKDIDEVISVILLGNNFVNILASAITTILAIRIWGDSFIAMASLLLTIVILIFAEITPKTFAAKHPEKILLPSVGIIWFLIKLLKPLVFLLTVISRNLLKVFNLKKDFDEQKLSREELKVAVNEARGFVSSKYQKMLLNIINLEKETVDDIMIPRNELLGVDINDFELILKQIAHTQHTRLLVFEGNEKNIIGLIHMRNVVNLFAENNFNINNLRKIIKEPYYILKGTKLSKQLENFQKNKRRLALIVDEYGTVKGLIVLEDILEEIVGNFTSNLNESFDEIEKQEDGSYLIDARVNIKEVNRYLNINIPTDGAKTINGLILERLESIPKKNISLKIDNYFFDIVQVSKYGTKLVKLIIE
ncbi:Magnesium and cobalt efflux protein CorC [hydrothermal vent metagenome]|uniref:Magnesium and cobalt efflux protein CorC n=1 Tax=hydrothermal vent metagenome TaxID=652676 RepID=A0A1W1CP09_9ZZZZ